MACRDCEGFGCSECRGEKRRPSSGCELCRGYCAPSECPACQPSEPTECANCGAEISEPELCTECSHNPVTGDTARCRECGTTEDLDHDGHGVFCPTHIHGCDECHMNECECDPYETPTTGHMFGGTL